MAERAGMSLEAAAGPSDLLVTVVRLEALRVLTGALYISLQSSFACFF